MSDRAHAYGCRCGQCRAMIAAICAQGADGEYFFTDEELYRLSVQGGDETDAVFLEDDADGTARDLQ